MKYIYIRAQVSDNFNTGGERFRARLAEVINEHELIGKPDIPATWVEVEENLPEDWAYDPNANLAEQEELMLFLDDGAASNGFELDAAAERLTELQDAMNDWLANGGFAPDWTKAPNASRYYAKWIAWHDEDAELLDE
jgi:hypothetical protein